MIIAAYASCNLQHVINQQARTIHCILQVQLHRATRCNFMTKKLANFILRYLGRIIMGNTQTLKQPKDPSAMAITMHYYHRM